MKRLSLQTDEIINHANGDEHPECGKKFPLLEQISFARFPNDVGNVAHRAMNRQSARANIFPNAKRRADQTDEQAEIQNHEAGNAAVKKRNVLQRWQMNIC